MFCWNSVVLPVCRMNKNTNIIAFVTMIIAGSPDKMSENCCELYN